MRLLWKSVLRGAALLCATALFAGCASTGGRDGNFLGLIETRDASFRPSPPATIAVSTSEIANRDEPSGRETRLLWGLITIQDY